jgi:hypothetical protein
MMVYFLAFLVLALTLGAGAFAAGAVAALPPWVLSHAEEAGRYARLGREAAGFPGRPASGRRVRALAPLEAARG